MKNTYGTGCFLLMNTGTEPVISENGLLNGRLCTDARLFCLPPLPDCLTKMGKNNKLYPQKCEWFPSPFLSASIMIY